ncbi:MAG: hypothetical protein ACI9JL_004002 [Paracoccaceae bacterium]|jgi:hypothetical protein
MSSRCRLGQLITPETDTIYRGSKAVFEEDIDVLNRQQEVLSRVGTQGTWQNIHSDAGAVYARRVVDELLAAEAG